MLVTEQDLAAQKALVRYLQQKQKVAQEEARVASVAFERERALLREMRQRFYNPDCARCGHKETLHHPTRTETWCIRGIADRSGACRCPAYERPGDQPGLTERNPA